ncbi:MAG: hypothetical protein WA821_08360 [Anaerolineales bacterium]
MPEVDGSKPVSAEDVALGTVCPRAVPDIKTWLLFEKEEGNLWAIGSVEQDKFVSVPETKAAPISEIVASFDGQHSIDTIQNEYAEKHHQQIDVAQVYSLFSNANLIADPKPQHVFKGEFKRFSVDVLDINIRSFFEKRQPAIRKIFKPLMLVTLLLIVAGIAVTRFDRITPTDIFTVNNSFLLGYIVLAICGPLLTIAHELSHAIAASFYGASPRHIKVALYFGLPVFYTDIAGIYTLKPNDRIKIWLAGSYSNLVIGCAMLIFYRFLSPVFQPEVGQIILKIALGSLLSIIGNFSPLTPTDGYFILSTLIKRANIRTRALQEFLKLIKGENNKLRGLLLGYFLISGAIIVGALVLQLWWLFGILREILSGSFGWQTLQARSVIILVGVLILLRLSVSLINKIQKKIQDRYSPTRN